ncbi:hypothetical protein PCE1_004111 [Barthelona sp. PCE]
MSYLRKSFEEEEKRKQQELHLATLICRHWRKRVERKKALPPYRSHPILIVDLLMRLSRNDLDSVQVIFDSGLRDGEEGLTEDKFVNVFLPYLLKNLIDADNEVIIEQATQDLISLFRQIDYTGSSIVTREGFISFMVDQFHSPQATSNMTLPLYESQNFTWFHSQIFPGPVEKIVHLKHTKRIAVLCSSSEVFVFAETGHYTGSLVHSSAISAITEIPMLSKLATAGTDRIISIWDAHTFLSTHDFIVSCPQTALLSIPDQKILISGGTNGTIHLFDLVHNEWLQECSISAHANSWIIDIMFLPDIQAIATAGNDGLLRVWDLEAIRRNFGRKLRATFDASSHSSDLTTVAYSGVNRLLFTAKNNGEITVWNPFVSSPIQVLQDHDRAVISIRCSSVLPLMLSLDSSGKICVWNTKTLLCFQTVYCDDPVLAIEFLDFNSVLLTGNLRIRAMLPNVDVTHDYTNLIYKVFYNFTYYLFYLVSNSRLIVFDSRTGRLIPTLVYEPGFEKEVCGMPHQDYMLDASALCLDGEHRRLFVGLTNGYIMALFSYTLREITSFQPFTTPIIFIEYDQWKDAKSPVLIVGSILTVDVYSVLGTEFKKLTSISCPSMIQSIVYCQWPVAYISAVCDKGKQLRLYDTRSGALDGYINFTENIEDMKYCHMLGIVILMMESGKFHFFSPFTHKIIATLEIEVDGPISGSFCIVSAAQDVRTPYIVVAIEGIHLELRVLCLKRIQQMVVAHYYFSTQSNASHLSIQSTAVKQTLRMNVSGVWYREPVLLSMDLSKTISVKAIVSRLFLNQNLVSLNGLSDWTPTFVLNTNSEQPKILHYSDLQELGIFTNPQTKWKFNANHTKVGPNEAEPFCCAIFEAYIPPIVSQQEMDFFGEENAIKVPKEVFDTDWQKYSHLVGEIDSEVHNMAPYYYQLLQNGVDVPEIRPFYLKKENTINTIFKKTFVKSTRKKEKLETVLKPKFFKPEDRLRRVDMKGLNSLLANLNEEQDEDEDWRFAKKLIATHHKKQTMENGILKFDGSPMTQAPITPNSYMKQSHYSLHTAAHEPGQPLNASAYDSLTNVQESEMMSVTSYNDSFISDEDAAAIATTNRRSNASLFLNTASMDDLMNTNYTLEIEDGNRTRAFELEGEILNQQKEVDEQQWRDKIASFKKFKVDTHEFDL